VRDVPSKFCAKTWRGQQKTQKHEESRVESIFVDISTLLSGMQPARVPKLSFCVGRSLLPRPPRGLSKS
jgi:hypothetical protein